MSSSAAFLFAFLWVLGIVLTALGLGVILGQWCPGSEPLAYGLGLWYFAESYKVKE